MKLAIYFAGILSLGLALIPTARLSGQEAGRKLSPNEAVDGIAVQSRGPVHEAFAELVNPTPQAGPVAPKQPPDPIPEVPPDQKPEGDNVQWVPGYWAWDSEQNGFLWVSGFWRVPPPDRQWVPGYWSETENGWQWTPGLWAPAQQQQPAYVPEPPPDSLDNGPSVPPPDENSFYVPGVWLYQSTGYAWRPGYWTGIRPGYCWIPAHYCWTPAGYSYVSGYWDYPLEDRGLLFAPVAFTEPLWRNPNWFYRPRNCVDLRGLLASLFCRPRYCHYYFGDYFGAGYFDRGFYPWFAYGRRWHSPLFGYYNWQHRGERGWYNGLVHDYRARASGELSQSARPVVTPLHELRSSGVRLTHADAGQVNAARQRASTFHSAALERQRAEHAHPQVALPRTRLPSSSDHANTIVPNAPRERSHGLPTVHSQPQRFAAPESHHAVVRPHAELRTQTHQPLPASHHAAPAGHHEAPKHGQQAVRHESHAASRPAAQPHRSAPARSAAPRSSGRATPHASAPAHHAAPASHGGGHGSSGGHDKKKH